MTCEIQLSEFSFGRLLVYGRKNGVGQPNREEKLQEHLANGIDRGIETTSLYERNKQKPPEDVFEPRLRPGQSEKDLRGIIPFFTRDDPDADEIEFLETLRTAYENWPNIEGEGEIIHRDTTDDQSGKTRPTNDRTPVETSPSQPEQNSQGQDRSSASLVVLLLIALFALVVVMLVWQQGCQAEAKDGVVFCEFAIFRDINIGPTSKPGNG